MKAGVLGTGSVGQTITDKMIELGHDVIIGTRDVNAALERTQKEWGREETFAEWVGKNAKIKVGTFAEAAAHGDLLFNCTSGMNSVNALNLAGEANLNGKVLIDISNSLDFSKGMPPTLAVCNTDSLGELLQRTFPHLKVVKSLNTVTAALMVNARLLADGDHSIFVSGNDADAKAQVTDLLKNGFGWKHVVDLGDIGSARGPEMMMTVWLRLMNATGTALFNFKVVT